MAWWTAASVIKGREYKSPYDWCQLNNHQRAREAIDAFGNAQEINSRNLPDGKDGGIVAVGNSWWKEEKRSSRLLGARHESPEERKEGQHRMRELRKL